MSKVDHINNSSQSGSFEWVCEKVASVVFCLSSLYLIGCAVHYSRISYRNLQGIVSGADVLGELTSNGASIIFLGAAFLLSFLRGKSVLDDYIKSRRVRFLMFLLMISISVSCFFLVTASMIYYKFALVLSSF